MTNRKTIGNKGVQKIFAEVPRQYELINHLLTFGMDTYCRRKASHLAVEGGGNVWLDLCTGTGETASYLTRLCGSETTIIATDFCRPMINEAKTKRNSGKINFVLSDVTQLPFKDNSIDVITISFATRNININKDTLINTIREFHRVLKPGGRFINLETSQPPSLFIRKLMHLYVRLTVKAIGTAISGSQAGYAYLSYTVPRFYEAKELLEIFTSAGFSEVCFKRIFFGAMAIHRAVKTS